MLTLFISNKSNKLQITQYIVLHQHQQQQQKQQHNIYSVLIEFST